MSVTSFPVVSVFVVAYSGMYRFSSSKISSGTTMLGKPFLWSIIGTMIANPFALYLAEMRLTCNMAWIFGFVLGVRVLVWGCVGSCPRGRRGSSGCAGLSRSCSSCCCVGRDSAGVLAELSSFCL